MEDKLNYIDSISELQSRIKSIEEENRTETLTKLNLIKENMELKEELSKTMLKVTELTRKLSQNEEKSRNQNEEITFLTKSIMDLTEKISQREMGICEEIIRNSNMEMYLNMVLSEKAGIEDVINQKNKVFDSQKEVYIKKINELDLKIMNLNEEVSILTIKNEYLEMSYTFKNKENQLKSTSLQLKNEENEKEISDLTKKMLVITAENTKKEGIIQEKDKELMILNEIIRLININADINKLIKETMNSSLKIEPCLLIKQNSKLNNDLLKLNEELTKEKEKNKSQVKELTEEKVRKEALINELNFYKEYNKELLLRRNLTESNKYSNSSLYSLRKNIESNHGKNEYNKVIIDSIDTFQLTLCSLFQRNEEYKVEIERIKQGNECLLLKDSIQNEENQEKQVNFCSLDKISTKTMIQTESNTVDLEKIFNEDIKKIENIYISKEKRLLTEIDSLKNEVNQMRINNNEIYNKYTLLEKDNHLLKTKNFQLKSENDIVNNENESNKQLKIELINTKNQLEKEKQSIFHMLNTVKKDCLSKIHNEKQEFLEKIEDFHRNQLMIKANLNEITMKINLLIESMSNTNHDENEYLRSVFSQVVLYKEKTQSLFKENLVLNRKISKLTSQIEFNSINSEVELKEKTENDYLNHKRLYENEENSRKTELESVLNEVFQLKTENNKLIEENSTLKLRIKVKNEEETRILHGNYEDNERIPIQKAALKKIDELNKELLDVYNENITIKIKNQDLTNEFSLIKEKLTQITIKDTKDKAKNMNIDSLICLKDKEITELKKEISQIKSKSKENEDLLGNIIILNSKLKENEENNKKFVKDFYLQMNKAKRIIEFLISTKENNDKDSKYKEDYESLMKSFEEYKKEEDKRNIGYVNKDIKEIFSSYRKNLLSSIQIIKYLKENQKE